MVFVFQMGYRMGVDFAFAVVSDTMDRNALQPGLIVTVF